MTTRYCWFSVAMLLVSFLSSADAEALMEKTFEVSNLGQGVEDIKQILDDKLVFLDSPSAEASSLEQNEVDEIDRNSFEAPEMTPERVRNVDYYARNGSVLARFKTPMEYHHFVDSTKVLDRMEDEKNDRINILGSNSKNSNNNIKNINKNETLDIYHHDSKKMKSIVKHTMSHKLADMGMLLDSSENKPEKGERLGQKTNYSFKTKERKPKKHTKNRKKVTGEIDQDYKRMPTSSEGKNYKFYEDIVSFEDDGEAGKLIPEKQEDGEEYQLIGDDFQKVYVNNTTTIKGEDGEEVIGDNSRGNIYGDSYYDAEFEDPITNSATITVSTHKSAVRNQSQGTITQGAASRDHIQVISTSAERATISDHNQMKALSTQKATLGEKGQMKATSTQKATFGDQSQMKTTSELKSTARSSQKHHQQINADSTTEATKRFDAPPLSQPDYQDILQMDKILEASKKEQGNDYGFFVEDVKSADKDYEPIEPIQDTTTTAPPLPEQKQQQPVAKNKEIGLDHKETVRSEGVQQEADFKPLQEELSEEDWFDSRELVNKARESEEMDKEKSINKLYREKIYMKLEKNRPLWKQDLAESEEVMQKFIEEKTSSVPYEKVINSILHYFESIAINGRQAVKQFLFGFKSDEKMIVNALYSIYLKEDKSVEWFFESAITELTLYDENSSEFKKTVRQNLGKDVVAFMEKQESSYDIMDLFDAQVPGVKQHFIKEMIISSLETRWQAYFHEENMQKLSLKEFEQEIKQMEFAWGSFSNKSAVPNFPESFFGGEQGEMRAMSWIVSSSGMTNESFESWLAKQPSDNSSKFSSAEEFSKQLLPMLKTAASNDLNTSQLVKFISNKMNENLRLVWESISRMENGLEAKLNTFKNFLKNPSKLEYVNQGLKGIEEQSSKAEFQNIVGMLSKLSKKIYIGENPIPGDSLAQEAFFVLKLPTFLPEKYATKLNSLETVVDKMNYFKELYTNNKDELAEYFRKTYHGVVKMNFGDETDAWKKIADQNNTNVNGTSGLEGNSSKLVTEEGIEKTENFLKHGKKENSSKLAADEGTNNKDNSSKLTVGDTYDSKGNSSKLAAENGKESKDNSSKLSSQEGSETKVNSYKLSSDDSKANSSKSSSQNGKDDKGNSSKLITEDKESKGNSSKLSAEDAKDINGNTSKQNAEEDIESKGNSSKLAAQEGIEKTENFSKYGNKSMKDNSSILSPEDGKSKKENSSKIFAEDGKDTKGNSAKLAAVEGQNNIGNASKLNNFDGNNSKGISQNFAGKEIKEDSSKSTSQDGKDAKGNISKLSYEDSKDTQGNSSKLLTAEGKNTKGNLSTLSSEDAKDNKVNSSKSSEDGKDTKGNSSNLSFENGKETNGNLSKLNYEDGMDTKGNSSKLSSQDGKDSKGNSSKLSTEDGKDSKGNSSKLSTEDSKDSKGNSSKSSTENSKDSKGNSSKLSSEDGKDSKGNSSKLSSEDGKDSKENSSKLSYKDGKDSKVNSSKLSSENRKDSNGNSSKLSTENSKGSKGYSPKLSSEDDKDTKGNSSKLAVEVDTDALGKIGQNMGNDTGMNTKWETKNNPYETFMSYNNKPGTLNISHSDGMLGDVKSDGKQNGGGYSWSWSSNQGFKDDKDLQGKDQSMNNFISSMFGNDTTFFNNGLISNFSTLMEIPQSEMKSWKTFSNSDMQNMFDKAKTSVNDGTPVHFSGQEQQMWSLLEPQIKKKIGHIQTFNADHPNQTDNLQKLMSKTDFVVHGLTDINASVGKQGGNNGTSSRWESSSFETANDADGIRNGTGNKSGSSFFSSQRESFVRNDDDNKTSNADKGKNNSSKDLGGPGSSFHTEEFFETKNNSHKANDTESGKKKNLLEEQTQNISSSEKSGTSTPSLSVKELKKSSGLNFTTSGDLKSSSYKKEENKTERDEKWETFNSSPTASSDMKNDSSGNGSGSSQSNRILKLGGKKSQEETFVPFSTSASEPKATTDIKYFTTKSAGPKDAEEAKIVRTSTIGDLAKAVKDVVEELNKEFGDNYEDNVDLAKMLPLLEEKLRNLKASGKNSKELEEKLEKVKSLLKSSSIQEGRSSTQSVDKYNVTNTSTTAQSTSGGTTSAATTGKGATENGPVPGSVLPDAKLPQPGMGSPAKTLAPSSQTTSTSSTGSAYSTKATKFLSTTATSDSSAASLSSASSANLSSSTNATTVAKNTGTTLTTFSILKSSLSSSLETKSFESKISQSQYTTDKKMTTTLNKADTTSKLDTTIVLKVTSELPTYTTNLAQKGMVFIPSTILTGSRLNVNSTATTGANYSSVSSIQASSSNFTARDMSTGKSTSSTSSMTKSTEGLQSSKKMSADSPEKSSSASESISSIKPFSYNVSGSSSSSSKSTSPISSTTAARDKKPDDTFSSSTSTMSSAQTSRTSTMSSANKSGTSTGKSAQTTNTSTMSSAQTSSISTVSSTKTSDTSSKSKYSTVSSANKSTGKMSSNNSDSSKKSEIISIKNESSSFNSSVSSKSTTVSGNKLLKGYHAQSAQNETASTVSSTKKSDAKMSKNTSSEEQGMSEKASSKTTQSYLMLSTNTTPHSHEIATRNLSKANTSESERGPEISADSYQNASAVRTGMSTANSSRSKTTLASPSTSLTTSKSVSLATVKTSSKTMTSSSSTTSKYILSTTSAATSSTATIKTTSASTQPTTSTISESMLSTSSGTSSPSTSNTSVKSTSATTSASLSSMTSGSVTSVTTQLNALPTGAALQPGQAKPLSNATVSLATGPTTTEASALPHHVAAQSATSAAYKTITHSTSRSTSLPTARTSTQTTSKSTQTTSTSTQTTSTSTQTTSTFTQTTSTSTQTTSTSTQTTSTYTETISTFKKDTTIMETSKSTTSETTARQESTSTTEGIKPETTDAPEKSGKLPQEAGEEPTETIPTIPDIPSLDEFATTIRPYGTSTDSTTEDNLLPKGNKLAQPANLPGGVLPDKLPQDATQSPAESADTSTVGADVEQAMEFTDSDMFTLAEEGGEEASSWTEIGIEFENASESNISGNLEEDVDIGKDILDSIYNISSTFEEAMKHAGLNGTASNASEVQFTEYSTQSTTTSTTQSSTSTAKTSTFTTSTSTSTKSTRTSTTTTTVITPTTTTTDSKKDKMPQASSTSSPYGPEKKATDAVVSSTTTTTTAGLPQQNRTQPSNRMLSEENASMSRVVNGSSQSSQRESETVCAGKTRFCRSGNVEFKRSCQQNCYECSEGCKVGSKRVVRDSCPNFVEYEEKMASGQWERKKCPKKSLFLVALQCCVLVHDRFCRANCIPSTVSSNQ